MTGARRARTGAAVVLVVALVAVSGCARGGGKRKAAAAAEQQAVLADIERRLKEQPHVQSVVLRYANNFSAPGSVSVTVRVERGRYPSLDAVLDLAEREVWRSPLKPLVGMDLAATELPGMATKGRTVSVTNEAARLTAQYGARPG